LYKHGRQVKREREVGEGKKSYADLPYRATTSTAIRPMANITAAIVAAGMFVELFSLLRVT
jgi:hypothetical protein